MIAIWKEKWKEKQPIITMGANRQTSLKAMQKHVIVHHTYDEYISIYINSKSNLILCCSWIETYIYEIILKGHEAV